MTKNSLSVVFLSLLIPGFFTLCSLLYAGDETVSGSSGTDGVSTGSWGNTTSALADEILKHELEQIRPPQDGFHLPYEATGKEFILPNNPIFPNLKLTSTEEIHISIEAVTNTISFKFEPLTTTTASETTIAVSGLEPFWKDKPESIPLFRHQDGAFVEEFKITDSGTHSWVQDIKTKHHIYILPHKGTLVIGLEAKGLSAPSSPPYNYISGTRTYTLTQDISESIVITANNITLDGNGHIIRGPGDYGAGAGYGIYLNGVAPPGEYTNVTIKNCNIQNFAYGIYLIWSHQKNLLSNNTCINNTTDGIYFYYSHDNDVFSNTVKSNGQNGIMISKCAWTDVISNTVTSNGNNGIYLIWRDGNIMSPGNNINGNKTISNSANGIVFDAVTGSNVKNNTSSRNGQNGIQLIWSHQFNYVYNNTCDNNALDNIYLYYSHDNDLISNTANSSVNGNGIATYLCSWTNLTNNTANNNTKNGLYLYQAYDNDIISNTTNQNKETGIYLIWSHQLNNLFNNTVWSNRQNGIYLYYSHANDIISNTVKSQTSGNGIYIYKCSWTKVMKNTIESNPCGVRLESPAGWTGVTNTIFHNNFIGNATQAQEIFQAGIWDNGLPSGGNYWSNYKSLYPSAKERLDYPEIWDTPYDITTTGVTKDNFPFTAANIWLTRPPQISPYLKAYLALPLEWKAITTINLAPYKYDKDDQGYADGKYLTWTINGGYYYATTYYVATLYNDILTISPTGTAGSAPITFTLTDSSGLTDTVTITITIIAPINHPPTITLYQPGMTLNEKWGKIPPSGFMVPIQYSVTDPDNDNLVITYYYSVSAGPWFAIITETLTFPYKTSYIWDVTKLLDDHRYKVMVEIRETATIEKYSASATSTNYFTIDNQPLKIECLKPYPFDNINPLLVDDETFLPFELSEPAINVRVYIQRYEFGLITPWYQIVGPMSLESGINVVRWRPNEYTGKIPLADGSTYIFKVEGYDYNIPAGYAYNESNPNEEFVRLGFNPLFTGLSATPNPFDPFGPSQITPTTISYTVRTWDGNLITTLKVFNISDNLVKTLINSVSRPGGNYSESWNGNGITQTGIYKYEFSGYSELTGKPANSKYGVITALDLDNTAITTSPDTNLTIYSRPITSAVTIVQNPYLASEVTYALGSIVSPTNPAPTYPVSSFYDIKAVTSLITPTIIAFKFSPNLSPDNLKLFRYDPTMKSFIAVGRYIVDPINHILYAEVDSLSIFVLMACQDTVKPSIQDLVLTYQVLNFTLQDNLSGINIPSIRVILDGKDITDKLTITGKTGDLTISVSSKDIFRPWLDTHTLTIIAQDRGGNEARRTETFIAGYADVKVVIKPEALNINSGILTAYLKFPQPFGIPTRIEATLDGASFERWSVSYEDMPEEGLTAPIVVMKFRRQDIENALAARGEKIDTTFIIQGKFDDSTALYGQLYNFEGRDSITKIITKETPATGPPEQPSGKGGKKK